MHFLHLISVTVDLITGLAAEEASLLPKARRGTTFGMELTDD